MCLIQVKKLNPQFLSSKYDLGVDDNIGDAVPVCAAVKTVVQRSARRSDNQLH
jgi:hypothetical protein